MPDDQALLGAALEFEPSGATFDPPIRISLTYDPGTLPDGFGDGDLDLAYFDVNKGTWVSLDASVEPATATVSSSVNHFTSFAVVTKAPASVNWLLMAGIIATEIGLAAGAFLYLTQRRTVLTSSAFDVDEQMPDSEKVPLVIAGALPAPGEPSADDDLHTENKEELSSS